MSNEFRSVLSRSRLRDLLIVAALLTARTSALWIWAGAALFVAGLALRVWAKGVLIRNRRLADSGPYALCRHPFYFGNLLVDCGICLLAGRAALLAVHVPLFLWVYRGTILREEESLRRRFPGDIKRISAEPRLIPRLPRETGRLRADWSFHRAFVREEEAARIFRLLAVPLLIVLADRIHRFGWWEFAEREGLTLLLGAAALHLTGHLMYQTVVRPDKAHALSAEWPAGGLATALVGLFLTLQVAPLSAQQLPELASVWNAAPVACDAREQLEVALSEPGLYLIGDDTLEDLGARSIGGAQIVRSVWSNFEVYHLICVPGPTDADSSRAVAPSSGGIAHGHA